MGTTGVQSQGPSRKPQGRTGETRSALAAYGLRLTAAIVSFTASADFLSAACSSGDRLTSRIFSNPLRASLQGTPQYIPDKPYSPCSQAAQGGMRVLSC